MLPESFFRQLLTEQHPDALVQRLTDTPLHDRIHGPEGLAEVGTLVAGVHGEYLDEMRAVCPGPTIPDLFSVQSDLVSFKAFVKRTEWGLDVRPPVPSRHSDETWERLWAGLPTELPAYFEEAARQGRAAFQSAPDRPGVLDAAVDSVTLWALCEEAGRTGSDFVLGYFRRYDTVRGIELLWRARLLGADDVVTGLIRHRRREAALFESLARAGEADWPHVVGPVVEGQHAAIHAAAEGLARVRVFATAADAWLMAYARGARQVAFGPERVFGYLVGLDAELHNLKVAVGGLARGVAPDLLAGRLRACYV
jgi:hypothetical protein